MGSLGQVKENEYPLIPQGEKIFELVDLSVEDGQWGERLKWVFRLYEPDNPRQPLLKNNGNEVDLWQFTPVDITLGSRQHEWAQVLSGRTLEKGSTSPEDEELIDHKMLAYLTHAAPRNDKSAPKKERIVEGSAKPYRQAPTPIAKTVPANGATTPAVPEGVDAGVWAEVLALSGSDLKTRWDYAKVEAARLGVADTPTMPSGCSLAQARVVVAQLETRLKQPVLVGAGASDELPWQD